MLQDLTSLCHAQHIFVYKGWKSIHGRITVEVWMLISTLAMAQWHIMPVEEMLHILNFFSLPRASLPLYLVFLSVFLLIFFPEVFLRTESLVVEVDKLKIF
jgi:hypothetical protein